MIDSKEDNRNQRRDKKFDKKKNGMRVNRGAKMLANVIVAKLQKLAFYTPNSPRAPQPKFSKRSIERPEWYLAPNERERMNREKTRRKKK